MTTDTKNFLEESKKKKIEHLKGILIDLNYHKWYLEKNNEEELRDELSKEQEKCEKDKDGRVVIDKRDFKKIQEINAKIDRIENVKKEKLQYEQLFAEVGNYIKINFVDTPEELIKALDEVESICLPQ